MYNYIEVSPKKQAFSYFLQPLKMDTQNEGDHKEDF